MNIMYKMNKKFMFGFIVLMSIALVSALAVYLYLINVQVNVMQTFSISGDLSQEIGPCYSGTSDFELCDGNPITINNFAEFQREIILTNNIVEDIEVTYAGEIDLINNFSGSGQFYYTIFGNEFKFKLIQVHNVANINYALLYFKGDFENWSVSPAILLGNQTAVDGELSMLGSLDLGNIKGGNILLIPMSNYNHATQRITSWNPQIYFLGENEITYFKNNENKYFIPAGSFVEFYPMLDIDKHVSDGRYDIEIQVD